jgi:hypothetical protein
MKDAALYPLGLFRLSEFLLPLVPSTPSDGTLFLKAADACASISLSTGVTVAQCAMAHNEIRDTETGVVRPNLVFVSFGAIYARSR